MTSQRGPTTSATGAVDLAAYALQPFLARLEQAGELVRHADPIELGDIAAILDGNEKAVLFEQVGPEKARVVGNVAGSRSRIAMAFGTTPQTLLKEVLRRLGTKPDMVELDQAAAPVQQVVLTGEQADFTALPIHLQHGMDGGLYVSASIDIVKDERTGLTNVGVRRLMLRGRKEAGIDLVAPSDLRAIYEAQSAAGKPLPVAFIVGSNPVDHIAATMRIPVDEMGIMASLRDGPMPVVRCVTQDILVPADAEYILEGYLDAAGHVEPEGPYGEFLGYYGGVKKNPVFHLTAITHRKDAVFQTATIAGRHLAHTDSAQMIALRTEVTVWRALQTAVREPLAVYATTASGGMFNVRISMRQRVPGEARNAIAAAFGCLANVKHVWVFDPDIDVFSDDQCDWAFATRFQADRDLVVGSKFRALPLDPSLEGSHQGAKAGFDCTLSLALARSIESKIPEPPKFQGRRFDSVTAALEDGPKRFEELMVAIGTRDGREVVRDFDTLRAAGRLGRDKDGNWMLTDG